MVIQLRVIGLKKTRVVYLLDLFERREEKGQYDLVCVNDGVNGSYADVLLKPVVSVVLVMWGVGPVLGNGYGD